MIEQTYVNNLSYLSLVELLKYGRLCADEISQIRKAARTKPLHEKKLYKLIQKRGELNAY